MDSTPEIIATVLPTRSVTIAKLAAALAKAQGAMAGAKKDAQNPHFRSKYADLASVWEACRAALSAHGLSVVQAPRLVPMNDTALMAEVETTLLHESGEWISSCLGMTLAKPDAHGIGSALTYARRYALAAMVGVAPEDDDANGAVATNGERGARKSLEPGEPIIATARVQKVSRSATTGVFSIVAGDHTYKTSNEKYAAEAKAAQEAARPVEITYLPQQFHRDIVTLREQPEPAL